MQHVIDIKNLTKDYGNHKGIFDVSFWVGKGECIGFLGPNGAGKTTTIRHLLGFIKNYTGSVTINELSCFEHQEILQASIGYLPGEITFIDEFNGDQFIKFMAKMKRVEDLNYAQELIDKFELDTSVSIKKMSKGMKQKLGIVIAFMNKPSILLLDEPSSGLDPLMQTRLIDLVNAHKKMGATILLSSHMFEEVERTCDRVLIIKQGEIVANENIETLKASRRKRYIISFINQSEADRFYKAQGGTYVSKSIISIDLITDLNDFVKMLNDYQLLSLDMPSQSLEEIFMQYYGGDLT